MGKWASGQQVHLNLPKSIDTTGMSVQFIDNIQVVDKLSVGVDTAHFGVSAGLSQLPLQQAVLQCVFHNVAL
jgi:hypothetical protein